MYPCPHILMSPMSLCPNVCMFSCPYVLRLELLRNGLDSSRKGAINRNISGITALLDEFNLWTTVTHKPPRQSFSRHFTAVLHQCLSLYPIVKTFWCKLLRQMWELISDLWRNPIDILQCVKPNHCQVVFIKSWFPSLILTLILFTDKW